MITIICSGGDEKYVLAIPTAAHSPARACRVLPRSIHNSGEVAASHRICIPRYPAHCSVMAAAAANDEM